MWDEQSSAALKVTISSKCEMTTLILFWVLQCLCRRANSMHQRSVLLRTGLQQTYLRTNLGGLWVCVRKVASSLSQAWQLKWGSLPLLLQATDASVVGESSSLLEGKATQPIEQQAENRSDNILGTVIMHSPDMPLWQKMQIKPPDVLCQWAWTAGHETTTANDHKREDGKEPVNWANIITQWTMPQGSTTNRKQHFSHSPLPSPPGLGMRVCTGSRSNLIRAHLYRPKYNCWLSTCLCKCKQLHFNSM